MSAPDADLVDALADAQEAVVNAVLAARKDGRRKLWDLAVQACIRTLEIRGNAGAAVQLSDAAPEFPE